MMKKSAVISKNGKYRYELIRIWDKDLKLANFVMLNPSTADAEKDDATIRKCIGFAKRWGYGGIIVTNLFPFRATDPKDLMRAKKPTTRHNEKYVRKCAQRCAIVVCAWGINGYKMTGKEACNTASVLWNVHRGLWVIKQTKEGLPTHPVRTPYTESPLRWC